MEFICSWKITRVRLGLGSRQSWRTVPFVSFVVAYCNECVPPQARKKRCTMAGWRTRLVHWRGKRAMWGAAEHHHRTRILDAAFVAWLGTWQGYQVRS